jgi:glycosyltransferase involved in cell wall biosynthesis
MRIALLSSWGIRCGLASYCEDLARAWMYQGHDLQVFCERSLDGLTEESADLPAPERCFLRTRYTAEEIVEPILEWGPDLVSIEHEFGVWPNDLEFVKALRMLRQYTKTIVTLHTVPRWPYHRWFFGELEGPVIVHHPGGVVALRSWIRDGCSVHYRPHGLSAFTPNAERQKQRVMCADEPPLALMPGFISSSKGHVEVIQWMNHSEGWNLEIIGEAPDGKYLDHLLGRITYLGLAQRVKVLPQYQDRKELRSRMAAAQVVILNAISDNYSASGQAADCISSGAMTVAREVPIYDALRGLGYSFGLHLQEVLPPPDELGRAVLTAAASVHTNEQVETMRALCTWRSWGAMALERLKIVGLA